ncbi:MAG: hypothetical protein R6X02_09470 [Enhygromyxa sp.]
MTKLGSLPSSVLASVLATTVGLAPVNGALAAPPEDTVDEAEGEGEDAEGGVAEGEAPEGEEADAEGEAPEGEEAVAEGEAPEGEEADAELPEADEVSGGEDEDQDEEVEAAEEPPPPDFDDMGPMRPPEPTWGPKNQYPRDGKGMLITGGLVTGLGAAFIVTSVLITRCDFDSALSCRYGDQRDFLIPTAVATTGLGVLLVGVGISNRIKYKRWQNWTPEQTAVVPSYVPGGGGVAVVGRF